jgi:Toluene-4-monooxygenase system protein B (TmoB)
MALFPIIARFEGDFVPHLVAVDTEDTFDQIAQKAAVHAVGRRLPERKDATGYEVSFGARRMAGNQTLAKLMAEMPILPLQWFDVRWKK